MIKKGYRMGSQEIISKSTMSPTLVKLSETVVPHLIQKEKVQLLGASQKDKDTLSLACTCGKNGQLKAELSQAVQEETERNRRIQDLEVTNRRLKSELCETKSKAVQEEAERNRRIQDLEDINRRLESELSQSRSKATEEEISRKEYEANLEQQMAEIVRLKKQLQQFVHQQATDLQLARFYGADTKTSAVQETVSQYLNLPTFTSESGEPIQQESSLEDYDFANDCRWMDIDEKNDDFYYQRHLVPQVTEQNEYQNDIPDIVESCGTHLH